MVDIEEDIDIDNHTIMIIITMSMMKIMTMDSTMDPQEIIIGVYYGMDLLYSTDECQKWIPSKMGKIIGVIASRMQGLRTLMMYLMIGKEL